MGDQKYLSLVDDSNIIYRVFLICMFFFRGNQIVIHLIFFSFLAIKIFYGDFIEVTKKEIKKKEKHLLLYKINFKRIAKKSLTTSDSLFSFVEFLFPGLIYHFIGRL